MAPFSTKEQIKTFEHRVHWNIRKNKFLYEKMNASVGWNKHSGEQNNTMSVMLCTGATFVEKNSCLVARIVSFDASGLHLLTFCILEPYPSKDTLKVLTFAGT